VRRDVLTIGALADAHGSDSVEARSDAAADARRGGARDRRGADSESRDDRRNVANGSRQAIRCRSSRRRTPSSFCRARAVRDAYPSTSSIPATGKRFCRADELIVAFDVPAVRGRQVVPESGHARRAGDLEGVMAGVAPAGREKYRAADRLRQRGAHVIRARRTEAVLARGESIEAAQRALIEELSPIDDIRSTASTAAGSPRTCSRVS